jgi:hypothetical protein
MVDTDSFDSETLLPLAIIIAPKEPNEYDSRNLGCSCPTRLLDLPFGQRACGRKVLSSKACVSGFCEVAASSFPPTCLEGAPRAAARLTGRT